jgi:ketosteroid isomerase-like protein
MRHANKAAAMVVVMAGALATLGGAARPDPTQEVLQIEHAWCDAYRRGDLAYLERLMVPDFTLTGSTGAVSTAKNELEELRSGAVRYDVFENRDMQVRFYGDTAIITGRTKVQGTASGRPIDIDVAFTDTLVRIDGRWRAVAGHASR